MLTELLILFCCCCFIFSTWKPKHKKENLPPGPTPLPLVGNLLHVKGNALVDSLMKFSEKYGSAYTLYFGSKPVVIICGYEAVKAILIDQGDDFVGRGKLPVLDQFTKNHGLAYVDGERWRIMRNFSMKALRDLGFGKRSTEWKIQEEAQSLVEILRKSQGHPLYTLKYFTAAFFNIICSLIFGERYDYADERFIKLLSIVEETYRIIVSVCGQMYHIFPTIMDYIPGSHRHLVPISEEMAAILAEIIKSNQETLDPSKPRHFIDYFLIKMEKEKDNPDTEFTVRNLVCVIHSLFLGATETGSTTMQQAFLTCLAFPEMQDKIQEEIDRVIGRDRMPNMDDKPHMPYTQAVLYEVQRFSDIVPFSVPRKVTRDTTFRGYFLPKGTEVYAMLCSVHRDPTKYATPHRFNPNHFLDDQGQFKKNDAWMPFSAGKRICIGEKEAKMKLFIFLTAILQNFRLTSEKTFTEDDIAMKPSGVLNIPLKYELSFIPR